MEQEANIDSFDIFRPKCQILAKHLLEEMRSGVYMPGQRIASIRKIAKQYGVGRQIVLSAFELLAKRNYIYTETGRGSFVNPDLETGKCYRLGFFVNCSNIAKQSLITYELYMAAQKYGYKLILGNNFEEELSFAKWVEQTRQIDGVILKGLIDEEFLKGVRKLNIPYTIIGNYDISESHPQINTDIKSSLIKALSPILMKLKPQRCAAVFSTATFKAHRETREAFNMALSNAGIKVYPELICCVGDNGYQTAVFLNESVEAKPDLIYIHEEHARGFQKYYSTHNCEQRPKIIINSTVASILDKKYYDYVVKEATNWKSVCVKAVKLFMSQSKDIEKGREKQRN